MLSLNHKFVLLVDSFSKAHIFFWGGLVRTLGTNPYVKEDLTTNDMDSKVLIGMREISQLLEIAGIWISTSQE